MPKRKQPSSLVDAAQEFDDALEAHARAAELFTRAPLASTKQIDRANELLAEIAACEERLRAGGQLLAEAVAGTRERQERLAAEILEKLPQLKERNEQLRLLLADFAALGTEASSLNAGLPGAPTAGNARDLAVTLVDLSGRAEALATTARDAGFEELGNQAHALHQRLLAASKKLQAAGLG
jgi:hypothetical protein